MSQIETPVAARDPLAARAQHWDAVGSGLAVHAAGQAIERAAHPGCPICAGDGVAFGKLCDCAAPAGAQHFALARRFIAALPPCGDDPDLEQAIDYLRDALALIDALQYQRPAAYVSAAKLERLKGRRDLGLGATLSMQRGAGMVSVYRDQSVLLATVGIYARTYLADELLDPGLCASQEHHEAVRELFAAIEHAEGRPA